MKRYHIQRKWALVIAIILTVSAVVQVFSMSLTFNAHDIGEIIGIFMIPAIFYWLAFVKLDRPTDNQK